MTGPLILLKGNYCEFHSHLEVVFFYIFALAATVLSCTATNKKPYVGIEGIVCVNTKRIVQRPHTTTIMLRYEKRFMHTSTVQLHEVHGSVAYGKIDEKNTQKQFISVSFWKFFFSLLFPTLTIGTMYMNVLILWDPYSYDLPVSLHNRYTIR